MLVGFVALLAWKTFKQKVVEIALFLRLTYSSSSESYLTKGERYQMVRITILNSVFDHIVCFREIGMNTIKSVKALTKNCLGFPFDLIRVIFQESPPLLINYIRLD